MSSPTPVRDGFRTIWRQPSIFLAELATRWSWGGAALILLALTLFEYFHTLIVTPTDMFLLRLKHPLAVSRALADIFRGSWPRVLHALLLLIPALTALWVVVAALGRWVTLRSMLDFAKMDAAKIDAARLPAAAISTNEPPDPNAFRPLNIRSSPLRSRPLRSLIGLNFLRSGLALSALISLLGVAIVASFVSTVKHPRAGLAFLLFIPLAIVVSAVWSSVNWFLSIAAVFVVREGENTFGSIGATMDFLRRCGGKVAGAGFWFGSMHLIAFVMATTVVMYPLSLATLVPAKVTLTLMALVTLAYFAVADWFHVARLAGYVSLVEWDRSPKVAEEPVAPLVADVPTIAIAVPAMVAIAAEAPLATIAPTAETIADKLEPLNPAHAATSSVSPATPSSSTPATTSLEDEPLFSSEGAQSSGPNEPLIHGFAPGEPLRPK